MGISMTSGGGKYLTISALLLAVIVGGFSTAWAQDTAVGQATANVLAGLSVTAVKALEFHDVLQGVAKPVDNESVDAGIFQITGASGAGISFYMILPAYLSIVGDSDRLLISFTNADANIDTTGLTAADPTLYTAVGDGYADVDPRNLPSTNFENPAASIYIYIGGKVTPSVDQTAGSYVGDILLTVAYDGT